MAKTSKEQCEAEIRSVTSLLTDISFQQGDDEDKTVLLGAAQVKQLKNLARFLVDVKATLPSQAAIDKDRTRRRGE